MPLRFLVAEGSTRAVRRRQKAATGEMMSERYAGVLRALAPDAACDVCFPAERGAELPAGAGLAAYDAVFIGGSNLQLSHPTGDALRQVAFARAVIASGTPLFGSCWGLQVAVAALGGNLVESLDGREVGVARAIEPSADGRLHALLANRPDRFDALSVHFDVITTLPPGAAVLARNGRSPQALAIEGRHAKVWGVQYHPELTLGHVAASLERQASTLVEKGYFRRRREAKAWVADLQALDADPGRTDLAWRYGLLPEVLEDRLRWTELANFIEHCARPHAAAAGRG